MDTLIGTNVKLNLENKSIFTISNSQDSKNTTEQKTNNLSQNVS